MCQLSHQLKSTIFNNNETWELQNTHSLFISQHKHKTAVTTNKMITIDGLSSVQCTAIVMSITATLIEVSRDVLSCTTNFRQIKSVKLQLFGLIKELKQHP